MKLHVKLVRSTIKRVENQKRVVAALGLRKMNQVKIHDDNPVIRGMIYKVRHLVEVTEVPDAEPVKNETITAVTKKEPKKVEKTVDTDTNETPVVAQKRSRSKAETTVPTEETISPSSEEKE